MGSRSGRRARGAPASPVGALSPEKRGADVAADGNWETPRATSRPQVVWPGWARSLVGCALLFHMAACVAGALAGPPSSALVRRIADLFTPYYDLLDLGYSYRFYSEPPPTPVVKATLRFEGERPEQFVRLPALDIPGPRMRHQRQLALANALFLDVLEAKARTGERSQSRLARAYARHLCRTHPGCKSVTIYLMQHLIPDQEHVSNAVSVPGGPRFDLFDESLFTTPERIGDFSCDGF
jgi:hypothetical protein